MKKAFSLLEIIFVLAIIGIIASYALKNNSNILDNANITKTKAEISLIRQAININKNKRIRQGQSPYPDELDNARTNTAGEKLFNGNGDYKLLMHPLISSSSSEKKIGSFIKTSSNKYSVYLSKDEYVEFEYNSEDGTFLCISNENDCLRVEE